MASGEDWAEGEVELDEVATADAVRRCIAAGTLVEVFWATDESEILTLNDGHLARIYPAGYVEDLLAKLQDILKGEDSVANAETHED